MDPNSLQKQAIIGQPVAQPPMPTPQPSMMPRTQKLFPAIPQQPNPATGVQPVGPVAGKPVPPKYHSGTGQPDDPDYMFALQRQQEAAARARVNGGRPQYANMHLNQRANTQQQVTPGNTGVKAPGQAPTLPMPQAPQAPNVFVPHPTLVGGY